MKRTVFLLLFLSVVVSKVQASEIDLVVVNETEMKMYLFSKGEKAKEYSIALGANPKGHKRQEGDEKTPEGRYYLDYKKADSAFYKAIHVSYPNQADIMNAKKLGVNPGGFIMIHGQKNGFGWLSWITQMFNWTNGCIAVSNSDMDEIWRLVENGTPVEIKP